VDSVVDADIVVVAAAVVTDAAGMFEIGNLDTAVVAVVVVAAGVYLYGYVKSSARYCAGSKERM
jgi:hypothetical protein